MNRKVKLDRYFVIMRGSPGVGKSTFSKIIAGLLSAVVIENDVIKNQFFKLSKNKLIHQISKLASYELLSHNINNNLNAVFDHCALKSDVYKNCKELTGGRYKIIICECYCSNLNMWRKRLKKRTYPWQGTSFKKAVKGLEKMDVLPAEYLIKIDTSKPLKDNVKKFLTFVKNIRGEK